MLLKTPNATDKQRIIGATWRLMEGKMDYIGYRPVSIPDGFDVSGKIWFRDSTDEWVLSISGEINDTSFECRHTAPRGFAPEDVAGLPHLYEGHADELTAIRAENERLREALDSVVAEFWNGAADGDVMGIIAKEALK